MMLQFTHHRIVKVYLLYVSKELAYIVSVINDKSANTATSV